MASLGLSGGGSSILGSKNSSKKVKGKKEEKGKKYGSACLSRL
jgi:hypothetical protein